MRFSEVLASLRRDVDEWSAAVPRSWSQGRTIFGGLQAALLVRAMRAVLPEPADLPLRSVQITFVGPVAGGQTVKLRPALLRSGRTATHAQCELHADGALACSAMAIFGAPRPSRVTIEIPRRQLDVDPETLKDMPHIPGVTPAFLEHIQLRWASVTKPDATYHGARSVIFSRILDSDCSPEDAIIALADSIPTPAIRLLKPSPPVSSLNWMLELLGDPANLDRAAWSLIETEVRAGCDGFLSQTSVLWGPSGHAFSVSHQSVAMFG